MKFYIFTLILISKLYLFGAAFVSVLAETTIAVVQIFIVRKEISPRRIVVSS